MCCDLDMFDSFAPISSLKPVHLPNDTITKVTHIGDIALNSKITLSNVLYIPSFKCNLLSVSTLARISNISVIFFSDKCTLQDM